MPRILLKPFEEIIKKFPDQIGTHLSNLEIQDREAHARAAKMAWVSLRSEMDKFIYGVVGGIRKEIKDKKVKEKPNTDD